MEALRMVVQDLASVMVWGSIGMLLLHYWYTCVERGEERDRQWMAFWIIVNLLGHLIRK